MHNESSEQHPRVATVLTTGFRASKTPHELLSGPRQRRTGEVLPDKDHAATMSVRVFKSLYILKRAGFDGREIKNRAEGTKSRTPIK